MRLGIVGMTVAVGLSGVVLPADAAGTRTVRQTYVVGGATVCPDAVPVSLGQDVGGGCWDIAPVETSVRVSIDDGVTRDDTIPIHYSFRKRANPTDDVHVLAAGSFCGSADLAIPRNAGRLVVTVANPATHEALQPAAEDCFGVPTVGEIIGAFRSE